MRNTFALFLAGALTATCIAPQPSSGKQSLSLLQTGNPFRVTCIFPDGQEYSICRGVYSLATTQLDNSRHSDTYFDTIYNTDLLQQLLPVADTNNDHSITATDLWGISQSPTTQRALYDIVDEYLPNRLAEEGFIRP